MLFKNFARNASAKISRFAGNTLPNAISKGASFFTNKVVPALKLGHKLITHGVNEVKQSDLIDQKHKDRASKVGEFADLGLKRLNDVSVNVDTVAKKYGRKTQSPADIPTAPV